MSERFRLAVTSIEKPRSDSEPAAVDQCVQAIVEAADRNADIVLLPEEPDVIDGGEYGEYTLESHPAFLQFQEQAAKCSIGVIATLSAKLESGHANTGFFLNRNGELVGIYRKKHPAPGEESITTTPVQNGPFPIFEFEGVKLGIAIFMDIHFPEMFRIYGLKGADIVCVPTMYLDYTGDMLESLEKARAIDSQMYLALSRYIEKPFLAGKHMGYSKVIAPDGRVIVSTAHREGVAIAEFDPKWRMPYWKDDYGDLRAVFDAIRRPDFYGELSKPQEVDGSQEEREETP